MAMDIGSFTKKNVTAQAVIASEAKQSIFAPFIRTIKLKTSFLSSAQKMDCFASLAMTVLGICLSLAMTISHAETPAASPQTIGQVVWVKNNLKAQLPNAEVRTLARRSPIFEHDTLMTDPNSSAEIAFTDDSSLALQENSSVTISQYSHGQGKSSSSDAFVVDVIKGGFRTVTGLISKNNPGGYKANTPVVTVGVMGTIYSLYFNPKTSHSAVKIQSGSILVSNSLGEVRLTKCPADVPHCVEKLYAEINGRNAAPQAVAIEPAVFTSEPPLTTNVPSFKQQGGGIVVNSFCIN